MDDISAFYDQTNIPKDWEKILEREMFIRHQHIEDIQANYKNTFTSGTWSNHVTVRRLIVSLLPDIIDAAQALLNTLGTPSARKNKAHLVQFSNEDWQAYCYLATAAMFDKASIGATLPGVYHEIEFLCEEDAKLKFWKKSKPKYYDVVFKHQREKMNANTARIKAGISIAFKRLAEGGGPADEVRKTPQPELLWTSWSKQYRRWLSTHLFMIIYTVTDCFELLRVPKPFTAKAPYRLTPSKKALKWVDKADMKLGMLGGYFMPLPAPPRPWTGTQTGGFWTRYGGQLKLIKNRDAAYQEEILELSDQLAPVVFKAVNAAQNTAWRINKQVFKVLQALVYAGHEAAGIPPADDLPRPICPVCGGEIPQGVDHPCLHDADVKRQWKAQAHLVQEKNRSNRGRRLRLGMTMEMVEHLLQDERFYYVYQTDFRGRLYPLGILTPQGTDYEKGMLEFADGIPLGKHGAKWLAVHIANTWGNDKVSYEERVNWTKDNTEWIVECAKNPLDCRKWMDADYPFMFLAACMEWAQYQQEGDAFCSHLAIGLDGSCSGIQHYSAMLKDKTGAIATNVKMLPGQTKKSDIYALVAEQANKAFKKDMQHCDNLENQRFAMTLISHKMINRKVTKRAVMTLPYGSTYQTCHTYVTDALKDTPEVMCLDTLERERFCRYASSTIWKSIPLVVRGARLGMDYLKVIARLVAKSNSPVTWVTPTGFPVRQSYMLQHMRTICTALNGKIVIKDSGLKVWEQSKTPLQIAVAVPSKVVDVKHQVSGIAPNFIHSLDASHLMFSVSAASEQGINAFALIHDSLGVHAGKTEEFFQIIREQFYRLYTAFNPLKDFTEHIIPQIPEEEQNKVPQIPMIGDLDLEDIHNALYLFS